MNKAKDLFVERRSQGDYAVRRPNLGRASTVAPTQRDAIDWANQQVGNGTVRIERVRNTTNGQPNKWLTE